MVWTIKFTGSSLRQLKKLDRPLARRILNYLEERIALLTDPRVLAKNLVGSKMGSYWRYRVGDVRVICNIQDEELLILVIEVGHRREVYRTK